MRRVEIDRH